GMSVPTTTPAEPLGRVADFLRPHAERLAAVGIACFGPIDLDRRSPTFGWITTTPKPGWAHADVVGAFRALGVPVVFDTDVNGAALGEHRWGAGRGVDPFVYLPVGTGIGGGAIVNGRPLHGLVHPEMGHVPIPRDPADSFTGACPYHGSCLEGLASAVALRARWGTAPEALPAEHEAWRLQARYLALGIVAITAVLSPRRIAVGGGVMGAAGLLERVRSAVRAAGHEVRLLDLQIFGHADYYRELADFAPHAVGFSLNYLANVPEVLDLAKETKRRRPGCFVFAGGHSGSFIAEELL